MGTDQGGGQVKSRRQKIKDRLVVFGILGGMLSLVMAYMVIPLITVVYDKRHQVRIECTVTEAETDSARFVAARIRIQTSDCGELTLMWQVTRENAGDIQSELDRGGRFAFRTGSSSDVWRLPYRLLGADERTVYSYEALD